MKFPKDKVCARVKEAREAISGKRGAKSFSRMMEEEYNTYREYESGIVNLDFLQKMSERTTYRIEWLLLGQLPAKRE